MYDSAILTSIDFAKQAARIGAQLRTIGVGSQITLSTVLGLYRHVFVERPDILIIDGSACCGRIEELRGLIRNMSLAAIIVSPDRMSCEVLRPHYFAPDRDVRPIDPFCVEADIVRIAGTLLSASQTRAVDVPAMPIVEGAHV